MDRLLKTGIVIFGSIIMMPPMAFAQTATQESAAASDSAAAEDPNDKSEHDRSFEETRKHMQLHSDWSKKSMKMNDN